MLLYIDVWKQYYDLFVVLDCVSYIVALAIGWGTGASEKVYKGQPVSQPVHLRDGAYLTCHHLVLLKCCRCRYSFQMLWVFRQHRFNKAMLWWISSFIVDSAYLHRQSYTSASPTATPMTMWTSTFLHCMFHNRFQDIVSIIFIIYALTNEMSYAWNAALVRMGAVGRAGCAADGGDANHLATDWSVKVIEKYGIC